MKAIDTGFGLFLILRIYWISIGVCEAEAIEDDDYRLVWQEETQRFIDAVKEDPSNENLVQLSNQLRITQYHPANNPDRRESIGKVVNVLNDVPRVSARLGMDLNDRREGIIARPSGYLFTYESWRVTLFRYVYPFLRSPETIAVLGGFLEDDRDQLSLQDGGGVSPTPENAYLALSSLIRIGLNDLPFSEEEDPQVVKHDPQYREVLPEFRSWFYEVHSGARSFSFSGDDRVYRFRSDGTCEVVSMIRKDADVDELVGRPISSGTTGITNDVDDLSAFSWWWGLGLVFVLGGAAWVVQRRSVA